MKTDRELLILAAKAAGLHFHGHRIGLDYQNCYVSETGSTDGWFVWSPLTDDGDALRLAAKLGIGIDHASRRSWAWRSWGNPTVLAHEERHDGDPYVATRRAIVRAAAALGDQL